MPRSQKHIHISTTYIKTGHQILRTSQHRSRKVIPTSQHYSHISATNITKPQSLMYCQGHKNTFT